MGYPPPSRPGWGTPNPTPGWGAPHSGMGYPLPHCQDLARVPPPWDRVPPHHQDLTGVPPTLGWGTPQPWDGVPPNHPPTRQSSIASTSYTVGGMPLAFMQEDFLVFADFETLRWQFCTKLPEMSDLCYLGKTRLWRFKRNIRTVGQSVLSFPPLFFVYFFLF